MIPVNVVRFSKQLSREMWSVPFREIVVLSAVERKLFQELYDSVGAVTKYALESKEKEEVK